jgi:glycerophosphoryl diester phosphodiesterase
MTSGWAWPAILAHRCGGALAPENTLAGLELAARLGCRAVEFDVMLSRDGVPMLVHDETLLRCTGLPGRVADGDAAELGRLDVGGRHHPAFAGEGMPTLEQALARCAALGLAANVEIKPAAGHERATGLAVGRMLAGQEAPLLMSSFSGVALAAAAGLAGRIPRALLAADFTPGCVQEAQALNCAALNLAAEGLDAAQIAAIHAAGLRVLVYTVNSLAAAAELFRLGIDGVFTDRPELFPAGDCADLLRSQ